MKGPTPREFGETQLSPLLELELKRNIEAPGLARAALSELSRPLRLGPSTVQTLVLLVSEVVSNAVLHSAGPAEAPISLAVSATADTLRVSVTDAGGGFAPRQRDPASINDGYGLYLVEKAASGWGVDSSGPTCVWFELPRDA
jgi:anti-sigma regulatory factor (Ser/Thr protein kinase)